MGAAVSVYCLQVVLKGQSQLLVYSTVSFHLWFETGFFVGLEHHHIAKTRKSASFQDPPDLAFHLLIAGIIGTYYSLAF